MGKRHSLFLGVSQISQLSYGPSKDGYFGKLFLLPEPFDLVDLRIRFLPNLFEAQAN